MGLWYRLKTPTTEPSRAWRLADDLSDDDDAPAPKRAKSTRPPSWTSDEEASLRTIVGELGGETWKTIAERLGTGRTGEAVKKKWAKLKAKDATAPSPGSKSGSYCQLACPPPYDASAAARRRAAARAALRV